MHADAGIYMYMCHINLYAACDVINTFQIICPIGQAG